MKDRNVIRSSQPGFTKGKSSLTSLIAFHDEVISLVDEERAVNVYLNFSKAFDTVSHEILVDNLRNYGLKKWLVRCIENCTNCCEFSSSGLECLK